METEEVRAEKAVQKLRPDRLGQQPQVVGPGER
jgi:hypothetical protein